jgi:hypothetical protein
MATIGTEEGFFVAPCFIHVGKILISRYVLTIEVLTINQFVALHIVQEIAHIKSLVLGVYYSIAHQAMGIKPITQQTYLS